MFWNVLGERQDIIHIVTLSPFVLAGGLGIVMARKHERLGSLAACCSSIAGVGFLLMRVRDGEAGRKKFIRRLEALERSFCALDKEIKESLQEVDWGNLTLKADVEELQTTHQQILGDVETMHRQVAGTRQLALRLDDTVAFMSSRRDSDMTHMDSRFSAMDRMLLAQRREHAGLEAAALGGLRDVAIDRLLLLDGLSGESVLRRAFGDWARAARSARAAAAAAEVAERDSACEGMIKDLEARVNAWALGSDSARGAAEASLQQLAAFELRLERVEERVVLAAHLERRVDRAEDDIGVLRIHLGDDDNTDRAEASGDA